MTFGRELRDAGGRLSLASDRSRIDAMNHEAVPAVLPNSRDGAKSIKKIAQTTWWRSICQIFHFDFQRNYLFPSDPINYPLSR
jgi:hypothetical protein